VGLSTGTPELKIPDEVIAGLTALHKYMPGTLNDFSGITRSADAEILPKA
jgi:hypothetical protein